MKRPLNRSSIYVAVLTFCCVAVALSCGRPERIGGDTAECVGRDCPDGATALDCQSDSDCEMSQVCDSGSCIADGNGAVQSCESSNDCAFGMHCDLRANSCVACLMDDHCEVGLVCQADGTCGDGSVECGGDYDCPSGYLCDSGSCVSGGTSGGGGQEIPCGSQADCDVYGRICEAGACVPCSSDAQCEAGLVCSAGTCTDPNSGGGTGGMPGLPGGGGMCTSAYDCPEGQGCLMGVMCGMCLLDTDCRDNERCDVNSFQCVAGSGSGGDGGSSGGLGGACTNAYDCGEGQGCLFGMCGMCMVDTDCRDAETCDTASLQCLP